MPHFTVVTACSRPQNLPRLAEALAALPNPHGYTLAWWVVFDAESPGPVPPVEGWTVKALAHHEPGTWGHAQANYAIARIDSGLIWQLDDDNLPHPELLTCQYEPGTMTLVGQQVTADTTRTPAPHRGLVDKAQVVACRRAIGGEMMPLDCFGDGRWVENIHSARPDCLRIDPTVRTNYNRLSWPS